jgi:hypothetical protein
MSATAYPPLAPVAVPHSGRSIGTTIVGSILIVIGALAAISGGALLYLFGGDRVLASAPHQVDTPTSALVTDLGTITNTSGVSVAIASPTLHVTASGSADRPIFVGVGPADAVNRYLQGVSADRVTDLELSRFVLDTIRQPGSATVQAPAAQDFWVATAQTTAVADLTWEIKDGDYSIVIMNADGSIGIDTEIGAGVGLPGSSAVWELVIVAGAVFVVFGIAVIVLGSRRRSSAG